MNEKNNNAKPKSAIDDEQLNLLIKQIEFVRLLASAENCDDFTKRIQSAINSLGFSDFLFFSIKKNKQIKAPFASMPKLIETYNAENYEQYDLIFDCIAAKKYEPIFLSTLKNFIQNAPLLTYTFEKNLKLYRLYEDNGIQDAYFIPIAPEDNKEQDPGLFVVINKGESSELFPANVNRCKPFLDLLASVVQANGYSKFSSEILGNMMHPKALKLLTIMAKHDVSISQAAESLHISLDSANKYIARAKKDLGTHTQANAVYIAIKKGFIVVE